MFQNSVFTEGVSLLLQVTCETAVKPSLNTDNFSWASLFPETILHLMLIFTADLYKNLCNLSNI